MLLRKRKLDLPTELESEARKLLQEYTLFSKELMDEFRFLTGINNVISKNELKVDSLLSNQIKTKLNQIPISMCEGLNSYLNYTLEESKSKRTKVDFIILFNPSDNMPCAVLASQKGECIEYPSVWTVKIICSLPGNCKGGGQTLMGCYMYCIKSINQKIGLLELAYGYENIAGYCSYSKFGFIPAPLFKCDAFTEGNLPMISPTTNISYELILKLSKLESLSENSYPVKRLSLCTNKDEIYQKNAIDALKANDSITTAFSASKIYNDEDVLNELAQYKNTNFDNIIKEYNSPSTYLNPSYKALSPPSTPSTPSTPKLLPELDSDISSTSLSSLPSLKSSFSDSYKTTYPIYESKLSKFPTSSLTSSSRNIVPRMKQTTKLPSFLLEKATIDSGSKSLRKKKTSTRKPKKQKSKSRTRGTTKTKQKTRSRRKTIKKIK